jgi:hypothetical protein
MLPDIPLFRSVFTTQLLECFKIWKTGLASKRQRVVVDISCRSRLGGHAGL